MKKDEHVLHLLQQPGNMRGRPIHVLMTRYQDEKIIPAIFNRKMDLSNIYDVCRINHALLQYYSIPYIFYVS